ncbi:hypothetical protein AVEN_23439-1 [Araneus ventricosus]|uniref:Uncharacterized protein n=1 Tax=Araneus ventricosus TaxID=182803 RepID=A0A4Y2E6Y0_ARAVE|nr:hypothetical protein AVEN_23439-1 [Araneus ventricosus]
MVFETASVGRNDSHSEQRLYLKSIVISTSPREHPLISNKNLEQCKYESYTLLKKLNRSVRLLNNASLSYTTGRTGPNYFQNRSEDPELEKRCYDRNPIKGDRRSKINFFFSTPPQLKSSFSQEQDPPQLVRVG